MSNYYIYTVHVPFPRQKSDQKDGQEEEKSLVGLHETLHEKYHLLWHICIRGHEY